MPPNSLLLYCFNRCDGSESQSSKFSGYSLKASCSLSPFLLPRFARHFPFPICRHTICLDVVMHSTSRLSCIIGSSFSFVSSLLFYLYFLWLLWYHPPFCQTRSSQSQMLRTPSQLWTKLLARTFEEKGILFILRSRNKLFVYIFFPFIRIKWEG